MPDEFEPMVTLHNDPPPEYDTRTVENDQRVLASFGGIVDIGAEGPLDVPDVDDPEHEGPLDVEDLF